MSWVYGPLLQSANLLYTAPPTGSDGQIKVWNGTSWNLKPVKEWTGSQWTTKPIKWYNGSTWNITAGSGTTTTYTSQWTTNNASGPFSASGNGTTATVSVLGIVTTNSGRVNLFTNTYLRSSVLNINFTNFQIPKKMRLSFKGVLPTLTVDQTAILMDVNTYSVGRFAFFADEFPLSNALTVTLFRHGIGEDISSDSISTSVKVAGTLQLYEVEYVDNIGGVGGTITFYVDGVQAGSSKPTLVKPLINSGIQFWVNASLDNTVNSINNMQVEYVKLTYEI